MDEKKLNREKLAELLGTVREFYECDLEDDETVNELLRRMDRLVKEAAGSSRGATYISGFVSSARLLKPDVTVDELCKVFNILGWAVTEDA